MTSGMSRLPEKKSTRPSSVNRGTKVAAPRVTLKLRTTQRMQR